MRSYRKIQFSYLFSTVFCGLAIRAAMLIIITTQTYIYMYGGHVFFSLSSFAASSFVTVDCVLTRPLCDVVVRFLRIPSMCTIKRMCCVVCFHWFFVSCCCCCWFNCPTKMQPAKISRFLWVLSIQINEANERKT